MELNKEENVNQGRQYLNGSAFHDKAAAALPKRLTDVMFGFCASQTLFAACELGIFDALDAAGSSLSAKALSQQLSINEDATCRILDALSCMELLVKHDQGIPTYSNTIMASKYLITTSPESVKCAMAFGNNVLYRLFGNLNWAVRDGDNQWQRSFNKSSATDFFKEVCATKESCIQCMEAMRGTCRPAAMVVVTAFDLASSYHNMCDLGGIA